MAKDKTKTENVNIDQLDEHVEGTPEKVGTIYRVCYLQDGINQIILDNKVQESVQCHTTGEPNKKTGEIHYYYSVKCITPNGSVFRLYLSSFDGVVFTAPYSVVKDDKRYTGKVKDNHLTDAQLGDANIAYRGVENQHQMLKILLQHTKNGICQIKVKAIAVGAENPTSDRTQVAVERDWSKEEKEYTFKGVKHLYSISFVD